MYNETRNELLILLNYVKGKEENKRFNLEHLLERYEYDIKDKLKNLEYEKEQLLDNLKTLEYVKKEILEDKEV